jgi:hypothetical protein
LKLSCTGKNKILFSGVRLGLGWSVPSRGSFGKKQKVQARCIEQIDKKGRYRSMRLTLLVSVIKIGKDPAEVLERKSKKSALKPSAATAARRHDQQVPPGCGPANTQR